MCCGHRTKKVMFYSLVERDQRPRRNNMCSWKARKIRIKQCFWNNSSEEHNKQRKLWRRVSTFRLFQIRNQKSRRAQFLKGWYICVRGKVNVPLWRCSRRIITVHQNSLVSQVRLRMHREMTANLRCNGILGDSKTNWKTLHAYFCVISWLEILTASFCEKWSQWFCEMCYMFSGGLSETFCRASRILSDFHWNRTWIIIASRNQLLWSLQSL